MTFEDEVVADGPELWWDTRLASGTTQPDRSGNGHDGTIAGAPTVNVDGLVFDGSAQWIEADTPLTAPSLTEFALEVVWSPSGAGGGSSLFSMLDATDPGEIAIVSQLNNLGAGPDLVYQGDWFNGGGPFFAWAGADPASIVLDAMQSVILDYDGSDITIYLDGTVYATAAATGTVTFVNDVIPFLVNDVFASGSPAGLVRHAAFYDHSLGATRAATHAAAMVDDPSPAPITEGPTVRLVTSRALVVPHQIQRWILPIICKDHITTGAGDVIEQSQDVATIRDYFIGLRRTGTPVVYQEGDQRHLVVVRDVSFPEGQVERWGAGRNGLQGILMVTLDSTEA